MRGSPDVRVRTCRSSLLLWDSVVVSEAANWSALTARNTGQVYLDRQRNMDSGYAKYGMGLDLQKQIHGPKGNQPSYSGRRVKKS